MLAIPFQKVAIIVLTVIAAILISVAANSAARAQTIEVGRLAHLPSPSIALAEAQDQALFDIAVHPDTPLVLVMTSRPMEPIDMTAPERTVDLWFTESPELGLERSFHIWQTDLEPTEVLEALDHNTAHTSTDIALPNGEWSIVSLEPNQPGNFELRALLKGGRVLLTVDAWWASLDELINFASALRLE